MKTMAVAMVSAAVIIVIMVSVVVLGGAIGGVLFRRKKRAQVSSKPKQAIPMLHNGMQGLQAVP